MHPWFENFFKITDYSRAALEGETPVSSVNLALFARSARGKSKTLEYLKQHPLFRGWKFVSGGDKQRKLNNASSDAEMAKAAEAMAKNPGSGTDRDTEIYLLGRALERDVIMEARLAAPILTYGGKKPLRVMLDCPLEIAAERRHNDICENDPDTLVTLETVYSDLAERDSNDEMRLSTLYPKCWWSAEEYDAVISTKDNSPEEVVEQIAQLYIERNNRIDCPGCGRMHLQSEPVNTP